MGWVGTGWELDDDHYDLYTICALYLSWVRTVHWVAFGSMRWKEEGSSRH